MASNSHRIGFIQGRLSAIVDNKIQAFPWEYWRQEFPAAMDIGLTMMEWTLDQDQLRNNPFNTPEGQDEIRNLSRDYNLNIPSLTGDCFMQSPFWKLDGQARKSALNDFRLVLESMGKLNVTYLVIPLVDNGSLENSKQRTNLASGLSEVYEAICHNNVIVVFESDFSPVELAKFIGEFDHDHFGINYDIGNSAALGYRHEEEIEQYGSWIYNVHVKDRLYNGTTVPLGEGNADLPDVFRSLGKISYAGNFILQTARSDAGLHSQVLAKYRDMVQEYLVLQE